MSANIFLAVVAIAFAWSMGAHYTGACMGMPFATSSISLRSALILMAAMTFGGAALLSSRVLVHIGHGIVVGQLPTAPATIAIGAAFLLTTLFTQLRIPTSTIQILVFALVGVAVPLKLNVEWGTILQLAALWICAPIIAFAFGFGLTKLFDQIQAFDARRSAIPIGQMLVVAGALASMTMGANDVSNATAVFLSTHFSGPVIAGVVGGAGLSLGVLTWGRPLLERVAFDIVKMDLKMAAAAQLTQGVVVLAAVAFGYFTSMNQALVGAMAGTGFARGRQTIDAKVVAGIMRGWFIGPCAGFALAWAATSAWRLVS